MKKYKLEKSLNRNLKKLNYMLEKNNIFEILEILGNKRKIFIRNLIAGISKGIGIGIGIGFTVLSAILIIILQKIVTLNIPIIGDYISDIVDIVETK